MRNPSATETGTEYRAGGSVLHSGTWNDDEFVRSR
jgi:hypothetical protein